MGLYDLGSLGPWDFGTIGLWNHWTMELWEQERLGSEEFPKIRRILKKNAIF
jgi:hypothetical protein